MTDGEEVKTVSGIEIEAAASNVDARVENKDIGARAGAA